MTVSDDSEYSGLRKFNKEQFGTQHPLEVAATRAVVNNLQMGYNNHVQPRVNFMLNAPLKQPRRAFDFTTLTGGYYFSGRMIGTYGPWPATIQKDGNIAPLHVQIACHTGGESTFSASNTSLARSHFYLEYIPWPGVASLFPYTGPSTGKVTLTHAAADLTSSWRNLDASTNPNSLIVPSGLPPLTNQFIKLNDGGLPTNNQSILMVLNVWSDSAGNGSIYAPIISGSHQGDTTCYFQGIVARETAYSEDDF